MSLYPLRFVPRFVEKIWGGRKLQTLLGKALPQNAPVGESWELYDFPPGLVEAGSSWTSSVVAEGPLAGRSLHELLERFGPDLHGDVPLITTEAGPQFPLLVKYLDAREDLSLQVHPDAAYAAAHPGAHLKTEAWYILQNEPGARIYKGVRTGVTRDRFAAALADDSVMDLVEAVEVKPGECHFLPSGTLHALGAGILVAEVQTPSDTTFRVFDFNRVEPATGRPRRLHVREALECIRFEPADPPQPRRHVAGHFTTVSRLCACDFFTIEKVRFSEGIREKLPYDQPVVWMMLQGECELSVGGVDTPTLLRRGDTALLPAAMKTPILTARSDCVWLEITFGKGRR